MRLVKYIFSVLGLLWLTIVASPYKQAYDQDSHRYFDDDSIFFGLMLSLFFLFVHGLSVWLTAYVIRERRPERADLIAGTCYLLLAGYYLYCANSGAALHEQ